MYGFVLLAAQNNATNQPRGHVLNSLFNWNRACRRVLPDSKVQSATHHGREQYQPGANHHRHASILPGHNLSQPERSGTLRMARRENLIALRSTLEEIPQAGTMRMGDHGGLDLQRQRQRFATLAEGDARRAAAANGIEK